MTGKRERRFVVLYYPARRRSLRALGRLVESRPRRLAVCVSEGEAEAAAERFVPRRQLGFRSFGSRGLLRTWGWTDRAVGYHEVCFAGCGCNGPEDREFVLIAEFASEALTLQPDVRLEPDAWLEGLTVERALALTSCPGREYCYPPCPRCSASDEEVAAAWAWRRRHHRRVQDWLRAEQPCSGPTTPHPTRRSSH